VYLWFDEGTQSSVAWTGEVISGDIQLLRWVSLKSYANGFKEYLDFLQFCAIWCNACCCVPGVKAWHVYFCQMAYNVVTYGRWHSITLRRVSTFLPLSLCTIRYNLQVVTCSCIPGVKAGCLGLRWDMYMSVGWEVTLCHRTWEVTRRWVSIKSSVQLRML